MLRLDVVAEVHGRLEWYLMDARVGIIGPPTKDKCTRFLGQWCSLRAKVVSGKMGGAITGVNHSSKRAPINIVYDGSLEETVVQQTGGILL